jgi:hypothetical protein
MDEGSNPRTGAGEVFPSVYCAARSKRGGLLALAILLAGLGCGPDSSSEGDQASLLSSEGWARDSAGILIVETAIDVAAGPVRWEVSSAPTLELGSEEIPSEVFFGVRGLRALPDGGILVVDAGSREVRFFDASGNLRKQIGRRGRGPGEFDDPHLVQSLQNDSLLLWDGGLSRFQLLSGHGEYVGTINLSRPWPTGRNPPLGAVDSLLLVRRPEMITPWMPQNLGPVERWLQYVWLDPSNGTEVPVVSFTTRLSNRLPHRDGRGGVGRIPLRVAPSATVTRSSALVSDGENPEIREYAMDGELRRIIRVPGFRRPVTHEVEEGVIRYLMTRNRWSREDAQWWFNEMPTPDTLPAFRSLQVDEAGWIWAEVFHWDMTRQSGDWMIFDPEGRAQGILSAPVDLQIQRIGEDFLLGVWWDDWGIEHVRKYSLTREPNDTDPTAGDERQD